MTAARLLARVNIRQAIDQAQAKRAERVEVDADFVLRELVRLAGSDVSKAFDEHGQLLPLHQIPEDVRRAISSVETDTRREGHGEDAEIVTVRKIRFWDKTKGLELLGKHLKLFTEIHEHRLGKDLSDRLQKARNRVSAA